MKKGIKIGVITLLLLLTGCTIGGSFFMLNYSLRPEAKIRAKNADSYPFMYKNYPFLRPWVDSLNQAHALRDTFVLNPEGIRLHAYYIAAPQPTKKTAVIIHGYTDNVKIKGICVDCGICVDICPMKNIYFKNGSVRAGKLNLALGRRY